MTALPAKTDPILVIDANAMLPSSIALQPFEAVARRNGKLTHVANAIQLRRFPTDDRPELTRARRSGASAIEAV